MPLPVPNLDDRRFGDLVAEARARLATHLPELTQVAPGDPVHGFIDLFAWFTETILYRANLIPERQRRVFLNLLQVPVRPARPSRGLVCVDASPRSAKLPPLLDAGAQLKGGTQTFTTLGELQTTPLVLTVAIKERVDTAALQSLGFTLQDLHEQYGLRTGQNPQPFQPRTFEPGKEPLSLTDSLDRAYYLALSVPRQLRNELEQVRGGIAGIILNIAVAPDDDREGEEQGELRSRELNWELMSKGEDGEIIHLPLEVLADSSNGGRQMGVARLRLPRNPQLFESLTSDDPMFAGVGDRPPELPAQVPQERVALWLRLRCDEEPELHLGYLGVNGVDVVGQGLKRDLTIGVGTGRPDQVVDLPDTGVGPDSLRLDVEENGAWAPWRRVDFLLGLDADERVFRLDANAGRVYFGNGSDGGRRPPEGRRIRVAAYRYGGGSAGNLAAGEIKELVDGGDRLLVRHELKCRGGIDGETVEQAERRIPQFLTHRNRAVTRQDFKLLSESNPVNPVGRAEVWEGFLPGASIRAARENVPGVVSVFVIPPGRPALGDTPKPTKGLLKDLFQYLLQRVLIGTELYVLSPEFIPIALGVRVDVRDPETEQQTLSEVKDALLAYLWPLAPGGASGTGWPMGEGVRRNELVTQVARVEGVQAVNTMTLFLRQADGWRRLAEGEAIELLKYQLPELMGISVATGSGEAELPGGIGSLIGAGPADGGHGVPAPIIPNRC